VADGLPGLGDRKRPGRPRVVDSLEVVVRTMEGLGQAAPQPPLPQNVIDLDHFRVARHDRISGILYEYHLAA
jgi:hypothetical protein